MSKKNEIKNQSCQLILGHYKLKDVFPQSPRWNEVIASGGKILTSIVTSVVKSLAKNKLGLDPEIISAGADEVEKILKDDIDEFA